MSAALLKRLIDLFGICTWCGCVVLRTLSPKHAKIHLDLDQRIQFKIVDLSEFLK